jgi:hypothetical protein
MIQAAAEFLWLLPVRLKGSHELVGDSVLSKTRVVPDNLSCSFSCLGQSIRGLTGAWGRGRSPLPGLVSHSVDRLRKEIVDEGGRKAFRCLPAASVARAGLERENRFV